MLATQQEKKVLPKTSERAEPQKQRNREMPQGRLQQGALGQREKQEPQTWELPKLQGRMTEPKEQRHGLHQGLHDGSWVERRSPLVA